MTSGEDEAMLQHTAGLHADQLELMLQRLGWLGGTRTHGTASCLELMAAVTLLPKAHAERCILCCSRLVQHVCAHKGAWHAVLSLYLQQPFPGRPSEAVHPYS